METKLGLSWTAASLLGVAVFGLLLPSAAFAVNPVPTVTAPVRPQAVVPGHPDFILTVYGANFVPGAVVNWNGSPRSTKFVSARELHAKILASDVAKPTAGYITVTNPAPGGGSSGSSYGMVEVHTPTNTIASAPARWYELGGDPIEFLIPAPLHSPSILDLLAGGGFEKVYLETGKGDGEFTSKVVGHRYYAELGPCSMAMGDFDNDGTQDYIVPIGKSFPNPVSVEVRLSDGNGRYRTSWKFGKFQYCPGLVVGDFNGDGNLDFATADVDEGVHILLGNGDGTFRRGATYSMIAAYPVLGDFNNDGKLDLVLETNLGVAVMLGNGDGTFQDPHSILNPKSVCGFGVPLLVDDFNADGNLDLAFCSRDAEGEIVVLVGNGDGTFKKPVYYHAGTNYTTWAFTAGDFNSDGKTDFVVWYFTDNPHYHPYFVILEGNGDGTFHRETTVKFPDTYEELAIIPGDFNSDGLLDFVMLPVGGGFRVYTQK